MLCISTVPFPYLWYDQEAASLSMTALLSPLNEYSVAVGMGNKAIYAVNAGPRLQHIFTPNPKYWICALRDVDEDQVIANKAEVTFPPDVFTMSATLHNDYDWDIKPVFFFYNKFCIM